MNIVGNITSKEEAHQIHEIAKVRLIANRIIKISNKFKLDNLVEEVIKDNKIINTTKKKD